MIKSQDLMQAVRQLAENSPCNVYEPPTYERDGVEYTGDCSYVDGVCSDGSVGCIMGQAMISLDSSLKFEICKVEPIDLLLERFEIEGKIGAMTLEEEEWCMTVQKAQDNSETWSDAVAIADGVNL